MIISFLLGSFLMTTSSNAQPLKKITITETNNTPAFINSGEHVFEELGRGYLSKLRKYAEEKGFKFPKDKQEQDGVLETMSWVTKQWKHDGMNEPPKDFTALDILRSVHTKKTQYRCVEYGLVLTELLQSYGFVTRSLAIRTKDVAYGSFGRGHVTMEVWLNEMNKWVFLDPQFGAYITKPGHKAPLSFYEAAQEMKAGQWHSLEFHFVNPLEKPKEDLVEYKNFLVQYFGHMTVSSGKGSPKISLRLEAKDTPITFQGMASNDAIFTDVARDVYPEMNRVAVLLEYEKEKTTFQDEMKNMKIETDEQFLAAMPKFAVKPNFNVKLITKAPWFLRFEYRSSTMGTWAPVKGKTFKWSAADGENTLEVRMVNQFERPGPPTVIKMRYN